jgi:type IV secretory pathway VirB4 component
LLDAEFERLGEASVQAFETEGLIGTGAAPAVLSYLFHRIGAVSTAGLHSLLSMKVGLPSMTRILRGNSGNG